jgi:mannose-6-phosphate isomerase-like protein (cupin superfamily)
MISIENAEHYAWGKNCDGWHLVKSSKLSVIQERIPPGTSETRHFHKRSRQFFYVLFGIAVIEADGKREILNAREGIEILPGIPHQIFNESDRDVEFLVISQPPSHGDRTTAAAELVKEKD